MKSCWKYSKSCQAVRMTENNRKFFGKMGMPEYKSQYHEIFTISKNVRISKNVEKNTKWHSFGDIEKLWEISENFSKNREKISKFWMITINVEILKKNECQQFKELKLRISNSLMI